MKILVTSNNGIYKTIEMLNSRNIYHNDIKAAISDHLVGHVAMAFDTFPAVLIHLLLPFFLVK